MGVGREGQAEVPLIVGGVDGLIHAPQHHGLDEVGIGPVLGLLEQAGKVPGLGPLPAAQPQAQLPQEGPQVRQLLRGGALVHPVKHREPGRLQVLGGADVGRDHELLDHAVGVVALHRLDALDLALGAEDDARLHRVEVDGPPAGAAGPQHLVEPVGLLQVRQEVAQPATRLATAELHRVRHLGVGQARCRAHHRLEEAVAAHVPGGREEHLAGHAQAVHLGVEGAEAVGERLGEHGDDPPGEVDRVAAQACLLVQGAPGPDVVRDVGDGHHQPPALAVALAVDGVVEVPGVLAVDGHQGQAPQVLPSLLGLLGHLPAEGGGLLQDGRRPAVRQLVGPDGHVDLHPGGHVLAQHLHHPTDGLGRGGGLLHQVHHHDLVVGGPVPVLGRHQDVLADAGVGGDDETDAVLQAEAAHHALVGSLEHLHHGPLPAPASVHPGDAGHHPVPVQHPAHLTGREEQVLASILWHQEAEAVGMTHHPSPDQVHLLHRAVLASAVADELAVALHGAQAPAQGLQLLLPLQA